MKLELALAFCKLTKCEYYKKIGKRKKAERKPTSIIAQINKHGDLIEASEQTVIGIIMDTLLLPETYG
jgi:hypothetical protein